VALSRGSDLGHTPATIGGTAPDESTLALEYPRRASRVELVGPMQGMSYTDRKWLICLDGTQYVQATELLYHLLLYADGETSVDVIATRVSTATGRDTTTDEIRWLVLNRLAGSGLIDWPEAGSGGDAPQGKAVPLIASAPILSIKHRLPLLPYWLTAPVAALLQHLFWPPLISVVVLGALAINIWLYGGSDFSQSVVILFYQPELVLFLFATDTVTRIWHELGHASALRRAGAKHGDIGFALYLYFPVYYTDVSHAYRLTRGQRIRVDLGGIYFDLISMIGLYVLYRLTGYLPLLLLITLIGFGILRQFTPFMRFDGYYLIADLMGVPEPMSLLVPFIRRYLPGFAGGGPVLPRLKPIALVFLAGYLALIVAFLTRPVLILGVAGGAILQQLPLSGGVVLEQFLFAWRNHDVLTQVAATLELGFWLFIPVGLLLFAWGLFRLAARILLLIARLAAARLQGPIAVPDAGRQPLRQAPVVLRPLPVPLDGLGRPIARPDNAAIDEIRKRIESAPAPGVRALAEEVARTYDHRLEELSAELERAIAWADAVAEERDRLARRLEEMRATLSTLAIDLGRVGNEMITAAGAASGAAAAAPTASQRSEWTSQGLG
jgi:putative peptide zinc metalloprotease protein